MNVKEYLQRKLQEKKALQKEKQRIRTEEKLALEKIKAEEAELKKAARIASIKKKSEEIIKARKQKMFRSVRPKVSRGKRLEGIKEGFKNVRSFISKYSQNTPNRKKYVRVRKKHVEPQFNPLSNALGENTGFDFGSNPFQARKTNLKGRKNKGYNPFKYF